MFIRETKCLYTIQFRKKLNEDLISKHFDSPDSNILNNIDAAVYLRVVKSKRNITYLFISKHLQFSFILVCNLFI